MEKSKLQKAKEHVKELIKKNAVKVAVAAATVLPAGNAAAQTTETEEAVKTETVQNNKTDKNDNVNPVATWRPAERRVLHKEWNRKVVELDDASKEKLVEISKDRAKRISNADNIIGDAMQAAKAEYESLRSAGFDIDKKAMNNDVKEALIRGMEGREAAQPDVVGFECGSAVAKAASLPTNKNKQAAASYYNMIAKVQAAGQKAVSECGEVIAHERAEKAELFGRLMPDKQKNRQFSAYKGNER